MSRVKKVVFLSLITAVMLVIGYFESFIPLPFNVPGVKLGIANVFILTVIVFFDFKDGLTVVFVRNLLSLLISGNFISFLLSLAGGIVSFLGMYLFYRFFKDKFSIVGISILGSVLHITAQMIFAYFIIQSQYVFYYIPILLISALIAGVFTGLCSHFFIKLVKKHGFFG